MGINHGPKRQLELKLNGKLVHDPAPVTAAFDKYCIDSVADIAHNFSLATENIIKVDESKTSFCIQPISTPKTKAVISSLSNFNSFECIQDGFYFAQISERLPSLPHHTNYKFISITGDLPCVKHQHQQRARASKSATQMR